MYVETKKKIPKNNAHICTRTYSGEKYINNIRFLQLDMRGFLKK